MGVRPKLDVYKTPYDRFTKLHFARMLTSTAQKLSFPLRISSVNVTNPQETQSLVSVYFSGTIENSKSKNVGLWKHQGYHLIKDHPLLFL